MRIEKHVEIITAECRLIESHGHTKKNAAAYVALQDVKISSKKLLDAVQQRINNNGRKDRRDGAL